MNGKSIPTIDISALFGSCAEEKQRVAKEIEAACLDTGFFLAANHGVDVLDELVRVTRKFHQSMSDEEKWQLAIVAYNEANTKQARNGYYLPIKGKKAVESYVSKVCPSKKDCFLFNVSVYYMGFLNISFTRQCYLNPNFTPEHPKIKAGVPLHEVNIWPDESKHAGFQEFAELFYWKMFDVSAALLRGFALALGKKENFFDAYFRKEDTLSSVRLIRYPYLDPYPPVQTAEDGTKLSFGSHEDASLITVLYQPCNRS